MADIVKAGRIVPDGVEPKQDDPDESFPIGCRSERTFAKPGRLFVFGNDHAGYYWNNWGEVTLTIDKKGTSPA